MVVRDDEGLGYDGVQCVELWWDAWMGCDAMRSNWQKMKKHLIEIVLNEHGWVIANMKHDDLNNTCIDYYRDIINK